MNNPGDLVVLGVAAVMVGISGGLFAYALRERVEPGVLLALMAATALALFVFIGVALAVVL